MLQSLGESPAQVHIEEKFKPLGLKTMNNVMAMNIGKQILRKCCLYQVFILQEYIVLLEQKE